MQALLFKRHPLGSLAASVIMYMAVILAFGHHLEVSSNYFILLPIMVAALGSGLIGGLLAGILALPANLLLFQVLGNPEYSPANRLIAELAGITVGFILGALSDYFNDLENEIRRRISVETQLRAALAEKELLLSELNHRVRNNLNVVKSLVQLQQNRTSNADFLEASNDLIGRIFAIALVHEQLQREAGPLAVDPARYITTLSANVAMSLGLGSSDIELTIAEVGDSMPADIAVPLGLIVNEALTNALKHAKRDDGGRPAIRLAFELKEGFYTLNVVDDGGGTRLAKARRQDLNSGSLGLKLMDLLSKSLRGSATLRSGEAGRGSVFRLIFP